MKAGKDLQGLAEILRERGLLGQAALIQNCGLSDEVICRDLTGELPKTGYFTTVVIPEEKGNKR